MAKSKKVEVKEPPQEPEVQGPYGFQDMNLAVEPENIPTGIGQRVRRTLAEEVHAEIGARGKLTFKPGDVLEIENGTIRRVVTAEGEEMEFRPLYEIRAEERQRAVDAQVKHQVISAGGELPEEPVEIAFPSRDELPEANPPEPPTPYVQSPMPTLEGYEATEATPGQLEQMRAQVPEHPTVEEAPAEDEPKAEIPARDIEREE